MAGPKHGGQRSRPHRQGTQAPGVSTEEKRLYWATKRVAANANKNAKRQERNKLRASARKSARASFRQSTGRTSAAGAL